MKTLLTILFALLVAGCANAGNDECDAPEPNESVPCTDFEAAIVGQCDNGNELAKGYCATEIYQSHLAECVGDGCLECASVVFDQIGECVTDGVDLSVCQTDAEELEVLHEQDGLRGDTDAGYREPVECV